MGAEVAAERWNLLIIREMIVGACRFNEIHRGLPGLSRTMLSSRLRRLERHGLVERLPTGESSHGGYRLTEAGADLWGVLEALGRWAVRWSFPEPRDDQLSPYLLLWRMRSGIETGCLPDRRVVVKFDFDDPEPVCGWLVVNGADSSVCTRDPMFEVNLHARASSRVWHEVWYGHRSIRDAIANGNLDLSGDDDLIAQFVDWFRLSPFADAVARQHSAAPDR